jgi:threonine dehydratase
MVDIAAFQAAAARIGDRVHRTPLMSSAQIGDRLGISLFHKCENFQKTGSFKARGALNALSQLDHAARARGVVTVSAGNHAQALAWAARAAGVQCTVVMPAAASPTKVAASRGYGAEVVLHGTSGAEAFARAHELSREQDLTFIHPFDDERIIAGQGTAGLELVGQAHGVDVVVVPIGGGGLIAGIAAAVKFTSPVTRVYGVEPEGAKTMRMSLDAGHPVRVNSVKTVADGLAAPMAGDLNYEIVRRFVDDVVVIDDDTIVRGLREMLTFTKLFVEPAGAAATAALLAGAIPVKRGERVVSVVSGGNVDLEKMGEMLR